MPAISAPNAISSAPAGLDGAVASESSAMVAAVPWRLPAWLLGAVLGAALQLQQPVLWPGVVYGAVLVAAWVEGGCARAASRRRRWGAHAATALAVRAGGPGHPGDRRGGGHAADQRGWHPHPRGRGGRAPERCPGDAAAAHRCGLVRRPVPRCGRNLGPAASTARPESRRPLGVDGASEGAARAAQPPWF